MTAYADTNFFTRLFLQQEDTPAALALMEHAWRNGAEALPITWLHRLEFTNAVQFHVFAGRSGQTRVTEEQAAIALATFREDLAQGKFLRPVQIALEELEPMFEGLSLRHTARHGFRTYDLLHVAAALLLKCDTFWSFDPKAARLARLEGLAVR